MFRRLAQKGRSCQVLGSRAYSQIANPYPCCTVARTCFAPGPVKSWEKLPGEAFTEYAPDPPSLTEAMGIPTSLAEMVHARVSEKLVREPVEDFRIDFEDGLRGSRR